MAVSYKFWKITSALKLFLWYATGVVSIVIGNALSPTSLAGPGLDMVAMLIFLLCWPVSFFYAITRVFKKDKHFVRPLIVHASVLIALVVFCLIAK